MSCDERGLAKPGPRRADIGAPKARVTAEIAVPMFDYKNHLGIDRRHGYLPALRSPMARRTTAASSDSCSPATTPQGRSGPMSHAARRPTSRCWRGAAWCRSSAPEARRRPMQPHLARGNAARAPVRVAIEHVFATQKCWLGRSSARWASPARPLSSASPTSLPTCASSSNSRPSGTGVTLLCSTLAPAPPPQQDADPRATPRRAVVARHPALVSVPRCF